jgi:hypothetical protein
VASGLALAGLIAAVLPAVAPARARAKRPATLVTRITTTTVIQVAPALPKPKSECPPGTRIPSLCEWVPNAPPAKAPKKPANPAPKQPAPVKPPAPSSGSAAPPAGAALRFSGVPPVSPLQSTALNLLLGVFPVPPFLLPIYHAAAADYGVPWQVLAAINEIESDYGRNLSTSTAGAVGWMQFLPSTWARFGVDADGDGVANPYDPVDAIFSAARYLRAAGVEANLSTAIFAYNHATWYVNSVKLRAALLRYLPEPLVSVLTGLMQARFPIGGHLGRYAGQLPTPTRLAGAPAVLLRGPPGAPVIASADSRVVAIGSNHRHGGYVTIEDSYGDRFTYSQLGRIEPVYPVLKPRLQSVGRIIRALDVGTIRGASIPAATRFLASASSSRPASTPGALAVRPDGAERGSTQAPGGATARQFKPMAKERLFADPARPASYAAGGMLQVQAEFGDYYSATVRLPPGGFALEPLRRGSVVLAGTILGRVMRPAQGPGQIAFQIRPAGASAPVDPAPIVAGWQLLGKLTAGRRAIAGATEAGAYGSVNPWIGQLLMASRPDLQRSVLADSRVTVDACARSAILAGSVDRRVLTVIEYLSYSGLRPGVSGLPCPGRSSARAAPDTSFDLTELGGLPVAGHEQAGSLVDLAIRQLLALQGTVRPSRIVSPLRYPWEPAAVTRVANPAQVQVDFDPTETMALGSMPDALNTAQWKRLLRRLVGVSH